jgi:rubrerythrin
MTKKRHESEPKPGLSQVRLSWRVCRRCGVIFVGRPRTDYCRLCGKHRDRKFRFA